jgi:hypothetical protein
LAIDWRGFEANDKKAISQDRLLAGRIEKTMQNLSWKDG